MPKLTLTDITNTESTSLVSAVNANNAAIEAALENTLSRNGTSPNSMGANLDLSNFRIINVGTPVDGHNAVTKTYVDTLVGDLDEVTLDAAIAASVTTAADKAATLTYRNEALAYRNEAASFVGTATSAQTLSTPRVFSFTGDVTGTSSAWNGSTNFSVSLTIPANSIELHQIADSPTDNVVIGRKNPGTSSVTFLTGADLNGILPIFGTDQAKGVVDRGGTTNTTQYLRRDGSWATPPTSVVPSAVSYNVNTIGFQDGYQVGNIIVKFGYVNPVSQAVGSTDVTFTTAFPTACLGVQLTTVVTSSGTRADRMFQLNGTPSASGFSAYLNDFNNATSNCSFYWRAEGY